MNELWRQLFHCAVIGANVASCITWRNWVLLSLNITFAVFSSSELVMSVMRQTAAYEKEHR